MKKEGFRGLDIIATFINAIAWVIVLFTIYIPLLRHELTINIDIVCIVSIALLLLGSMLEGLGVVNNLNYYKKHIYMAINIWFYSIVMSMICIYIELPYMWTYILYFIVSILVCCVSLLKQKNAK